MLVDADFDPEIKFFHFVLGVLLVEFLELL
jgi:hypothetical protein